MFHDVPWCSMMFHDVPWCSMMFHDVPWCSSLPSHPSLPFVSSVSSVFLSSPFVGTYLRRSFSGHFLLLYFSGKFGVCISCFCPTHLILYCFILYFSRFAWLTSSTTPHSAMCPLSPGMCLMPSVSNAFKSRATMKKLIIQETVFQLIQVPWQTAKQVFPLLPLEPCCLRLHSASNHLKLTGWPAGGGGQHGGRDARAVELHLHLHRVQELLQPCREV